MKWQIVHRIGFIVLLIGFLGLTWGAVQQPAFAQPPKKMREEEEEDPKEKTKVPKKIDENPPKEDTSRPAPVTSNFKIAEEAVNKSRPAVVRDFLKKLAVPYDVLITPADRRYKITPRTDLYIPQEKFTYFELNASLMAGKEKELPTGAGFTLLPFEEVALNEANLFLSKKLDGVLPADQLDVAVQALTAVRSLHSSWIERKQRVGKDWEKVDAKLKKRIILLRRDQLKAYVDAKDWNRADELSLDLGASFSEEPEVQKDIYRLLLIKADLSLMPDKDEDYRNLYEAMTKLEELPGGKTEPIALTARRKLAARAKELVRQAGQLAEENQNAAAFQKLRTAEVLDPELREITELRSRLKDRILYVAVAHLPERLSPALASGDSEHWGMELMFESLMQMIPDPEIGRRYSPILATGQPLMMPLGREFHLHRNARWASDSTKEVLDARDVQTTLKLLKAIPDRWCSEGLEVFDPREVRIDDPFRIRLTFNQGVFEPLGRTTFKVLPARYLTRMNKGADDDAFARAPFGSGPYRYIGREKETAEREVAVFRANPFYGQRNGMFGKPNIREIRFFVPKPSTISDDIKNGQLHLALDVPTIDLPVYQSDPVGKNIFSLSTLTTNRRIQILAVNHRKPILQTVEVRRGLAAAIERDEVLKDAYRPEWGRTFHRAMTGPFPVNSWATPAKAKEVPLSNPALAAGLLAAYAKDGPIRLNLSYAADNVSATRACQKMKEQIERNAGLVSGRLAVEITLEGLPTDQLRRRVEVEHDYDLAYYHFDYRDDQFSLNGLLDPSATGLMGRNFLGYLGDGSGAREEDQRLRQTLEELRNYRDFRDKLREKTWEIHRLCNARMPFIPLWQLDRHIIAHQGLEFYFDNPSQAVPASRLDPAVIFTGVEHWRLK